MGGGWTELKEASYLQPDRSRVAHAPWVLCAAHPSLRSPGRKLLPQVDGCPDLACFLPTGSKAGSPVLPQGPLTPCRALASRPHEPQCPLPSPHGVQPRSLCLSCCWAQEVPRKRKGGRASGPCWAS